VAGKDGLVVVVEVKARRSRSFGAPAEAVGAEKSRRVLMAGRVYCRRHGVSLTRLRGDVVTVEAEAGTEAPSVRHLPGGLREKERRR
jgi:putative endonuclease